MGKRKKKKKKNIPNFQKRRKYAGDAKVSLNSDPELLEFMLNSPKAKTSFNKTKAFELMDELKEAFESNKDERCEAIKTELEDMGCKVRMKPASDSFGVIFPSDFNSDNGALLELVCRR